MTCLHPDPQTTFVHPLEIMDHPLSGYILDIVYKFKDRLVWNLDHESLCGLLTLALRYFPALNVHSQDTNACPSTEALIRRLQVAGHLVQDRRGFALTDMGKKRRYGVFRALLADLLWTQAIDHIEEDLMVFAETEGIPLAIA
jgi:hypothetical protein